MLAAFRGSACNGRACSRCTMSRAGPGYVHRRHTQCTFRGGGLDGARAGRGVTCCTRNRKMLTRALLPQGPDLMRRRAQTRARRLRPAAVQLPAASCLSNLHKGVAARLRPRRPTDPRRTGPQSGHAQRHAAQRAPPRAARTPTVCCCPTARRPTRSSRGPTPRVAPRRPPPWSPPPVCRSRAGSRTSGKKKGFAGWHREPGPAAHGRAARAADKKGPVRAARTGAEDLSGRPGQARTAPVHPRARPCSSWGTRPGRTPSA